MTEQIKHKTSLDGAYEKLDTRMQILFIGAQNKNNDVISQMMENTQGWIDNLDDSQKRIIVPEIGRVTSDMAGKFGGTSEFVAAAASMLMYFSNDPVLQNEKPMARRQGDEEPYNSAIKSQNLAMTALRDLGVALGVQNKPEQEDIVKKAIIDCLMVS
jgi:hypothetical protein